MSIPKTLRFKSPSVLYAEVMNLIEAGKAELFEGMFVSYEIELCQIVLLGKQTLFDYYLIEVSSIDDFNASMDTLNKEGWEPYSNTVLYGGNYLQWMSRMKKAESNWLKAESSSEPFQMVVDARPVQLVVGEPLFSSSFPILPRIVE